MATLLARPEDIPSREPTPAPSHLTLNTIQGHPAAVPNKHIPYCSPGPTPSDALLSPPQTPPSSDGFHVVSSPLHPPTRYQQLSQDPPIYGLTGPQLSAALESIATQPLPDPKQVFPWLHGIHIENQLQLAYFSPRRRSVPGTPTALRAVTIVKAGGNLSEARLKGAIAPEELLQSTNPTTDGALFRDIDPRVGFSVRNFQIQAAKIAQISDIVVYGDDNTPRSDLEQLSSLISSAQRKWLELNDEAGRFNTFLVVDKFEKLERQCPELVVVDSKGALTGKILDLAFQERLEMCALSRASEISANVWLGPTPDPRLFGTDAFMKDDVHYDIIIEANDFGRVPDQAALNGIEQFFKKRGQMGQFQLEFPASGSMSLQSTSDGEVKKLINFCSWLFKITNAPARGQRKPRVLLHCADGYTETSLLALAFTMFAQGLPLNEAWIHLHREKQRNFFSYPSDKIFLLSIQERVLNASPVRKEELPAIGPCAWLENMDGSLPSRILPYLYLGNLSHAQNPPMLKQLGISRILSIGEPIKWTNEELNAWGRENFVFIDKVQDNGVDPLTCEFDRCLDFIEKARTDGHATLVHCRVGVSRSATICIAEVMKELGLSFPRAYCYVRARRLNVIIQPHLRFTYELLKWEELQRQQRGHGVRRELEWAHVCREIAAMNKPYCRS